MTARCLTCGHMGKTGLIETVEVRDNMHDRPLTREVCEVETCDHCGSREIVPVHLCGLCGERESAPGYDECAACVAPLDEQLKPARALSRAFDALENRLLRRQAI